MDKATFISSFTEGLELMKAAWSDEPTVTFHGRFRDVDDLPITAQAGAAPASADLVRRNAPAALARAVRLGDAFLGAGSSTTATSSKRSRSSAVNSSSRTRPEFTIGKRVYLMVDDDAARARERVLAGLHRIYGEMPGIEAVPVPAPR